MSMSRFAPGQGFNHPNSPGLRPARRGGRLAVVGAAAMAVALGLAGLVWPAQRSAADPSGGGADGIVPAAQAQPMEQPPEGSTLAAGFTTQATAGLVDVAWDQVGGAVVGASSFRSDLYPADNAISARGGHWSTAEGETTDQWLILDLKHDWALSRVVVSPYTVSGPASVTVSAGDAPEGPFTQIAQATAANSSSALTLPIPNGAAAGRYLRLDFPAPFTADAPYLQLNRVQAFTGQLGGAEVEFTDTSTGPNPITAWSWDFGDGVKAT
ncbi:MAG: hypothetical protein LBD51_05105, partial [Bifidobacteriaceae bacterium]|nr:hypothetical protein [Bifidobacteriaceae bacterium]